MLHLEGFFCPEPKSQGSCCQNHCSSPEPTWLAFFDYTTTSEYHWLRQTCVGTDDRLEGLNGFVSLFAKAAATGCNRTCPHPESMKKTYKVSHNNGERN